jgi:hypothetical protein
VRRVTAGFGLLVVLFMFLLVLEPLPVHAAATVVQQSSNGNAFFNPPTSSPVVMVTLSSVTSGDVLVVGVGWRGTVTSITDTLHSSFSLAASMTGGQNGNAAIYIATLSSSGPDTVTSEFSIPPPMPSCGGICGAEIAVYVYEVAGVTTTGAATATGGVGSGDSVSTSTMVSFQPGAFLLGMTTTCNCSATPGAGFTFSPQPPPPHDITGYPSYAEYSDPVSSPTTFPATLSYGTFYTGWVEAGIALNPTSPIPEYPFGLAVLAIFMIIAYGVVRRRIRNDST